MTEAQSFPEGVHSDAEQLCERRHRDQGHRVEIRRSNRDLAQTERVDE
jgi:hypothetical protein